MSTEPSLQTLTAALLAGINAPQLTDIRDVPVVIDPNGSVQLFEKLNSQPKRIEEHKVFLTVESFNRYVNTFKSDSTIIFQAKNDFVAHLDYHKPSGSDAGGNLKYNDPVPSWDSHKATLRLRRTDACEAWIKAFGDGRYVSQEELAVFIERWQGMFIVPEAADMLELVEKFHMTSTATVANKINRTSNSFNLTYQEENQVTSTVNVPKTVKIIMQIFEGGAYNEIEGYFRYKPDGGKIKFRIDLVSLPDVEMAAVQDIARLVEHGTVETIQEIGAPDGFPGTGIKPLN